MLRLSGSLLPAIILFACLAAFGALFVQQGLDFDSSSLVTSSDLHARFLPTFSLSSSQVFSGRLPLWNPYEFSGLPLLATAQPAALYPPKVLLFGLLDQEAAYWTFMSAHYVALALGMLWLMREMGIAGAPALAGAAAWTFGHRIIASLYHPTRVANLVWLPIVFVLVDRIGRRPSNLGHYALPALVLCVALQLTAGYPEATMVLGLLVALYAVSQWTMKAWRRPPHRSVPLMAALFLFAVAVAALQIFPMADLAIVAKRADMARATMAPASTHGGSVFGLFDPLMIPGFMVFVPAGLMSRKGRPATIGLLACLFMSLIGWRYLRLLPGFEMDRHPLVWVFYCNFFASWIIGAGCDYIVQNRPLDGKRSRIALCLTLGGSLASACAYSVYAHDYWAGPGDSLRQGISTNLQSAAGNTLGALLVVGGALGIAWAVGARLLHRSSIGALYAALTICTLANAAAFPYGGPVAPVSRPHPRGLVARLVGNPSRVLGRALCVDDLVFGYQMTDRIPSPLGGERSLLPWRHRRIMEELDFRLGHIDWHKLSRARGYLNAMNVEYLVVPRAKSEQFRRRGLVVVNETSDHTLLRNLTLAGWAWVTYSAHLVDNEEEALSYLLGEQFDPRREVVLEQPPSQRLPRGDHSSTLPSVALRYSPTELEFEVELERPGIFVLSESAMPGWQVAVDGEAAEWRTANYLMRAVELDRGAHHIRFSYYPTSVRWGLWMSCIALVTLVGFFVLQVRIRRRGRTPGAPV